MGEEPIRYVMPHFFDWGTSKAHGDLILVVSGLLYLFVFASSVLLIRRFAERIGSPRAALILGLVGLWPMVAKIIESLEYQMSTRHYQENVHISALITVGVTFGIVVVICLGTEGFHLIFPRRPKGIDFPVNRSPEFSAFPFDPLKEPSR